MSSAALVAQGRAVAGAGAELSCAHCGLRVPASRRGEGSASYCCAGCESVAGALAASGLARWHELRDRAGQAPWTPRVSGRRYEELDEAAFAERFVTARADGTSTVDFYVEGVHCAACVWLVERLGQLEPGVVSARLDFARARATIVLDPARVTLSAIARRLDSLGYPVHPWREAERDAARSREDSRLALRLGVAGACALNAMTLAAALYAGEASDMTPTTANWLRLASLAVSLPAVSWSAATFYRGAWTALRSRVLHVDLPLSLAILAAFLGSAWHLVRGSGAIYFDSLTALVFLLLAARWMNRRATRAAENAAGVLTALAPSSARLVEDEVVREVPVDALRRGELIEVRAGESLPVDGRVEHGRSSIDVSLLSGESRPQAVGMGDAVHAGTVNLEARLLVRVEGTGENTRLGKLAQLVDEAVARRAPVLRLVDRLAGGFVAIVLALSLLTLALWWPIDPARAMENALAMLIVTCPCVLAFATPLSINIALGKAARRGLLVKGGDALEAIARPGVVVLDKTGTLTQGRSALVGWVGAAWARPLVRTLETQSAHPIARALSEGLDDGAPLGVVEDVVQVNGGGIAGSVEGRAVIAGSPRHVEARLSACADADTLPTWAVEEIHRVAELGTTPIVVAIDGRVEAVASIGDPLRNDARPCVDALRARGWGVVILSGDEPRVVSAVARRLGLDDASARGGVSPEGKVEAVRALKVRGPVLMVGDGVNDAAALAAADVGLAVQGGAEASLAAADAFSTRPGLDAVIELVDGARGLRHALRANAVISIGYNAVGAGLCMAGLIGPLAAALLMPASSLTVTALSLLWPTFSRTEEGVS